MSKPNDQLCWDCQRAGGDCPWTEVIGNVVQFRPVPGWTATRVEREIGHGYHITACPLFVPDERVRPKAEPPMRGCQLLAVSVATGEKRVYRSTKEAERDGFRTGGIQSCLDGSRNTHKGWIFDRIKPPCCARCGPYTKRICNSGDGTCGDYERWKKELI